MNNEIKPTKQKEGFLIGIVVIGLSVIFGILASNDDSEQGLVRILFIYYIGLVFLVSYYLESESFVFRWVLAFCEKLSAPESKKMAFFYFALFTFLGTMFLITGEGGS